MVKLLFVLFLIVMIYHFLNSIKILVEQYYDLNRLFKCKILEFWRRKKYYLSCVILLIMGLVFLWFRKHLLSYYIFLLLNSLLVIDIDLKKYRFTRRNVFLLIMSLCLSIGLVYYLFFRVSILVAVFSILLIDNCCLVIGYLFLLPIEKMIQSYYIKKARDKVIRNHYIVIGITGSFGKTTTKNFIYSLLRNKFLISRQDHNYNTLMGLCRYINDEVSSEDEILLVELGVDHLNSMKKFSKLFKLDYAIITAVGEMHLSTFKSVDNVLKEKISIVSLLKEDGKVFISNDILNNYREKINFEYELFSYLDIEFEKSIFYSVKYGGEVVKTKLISKYQLSSLSLAIKLSRLLGLSDQEILFGINNLEIPLRRCSIYYVNNLMVIDNSYNGNLNGISELVDSIESVNKTKVVITGGLIELGDKFYSSNFKLGQKMSKFDLVIFIGNDVNHPLVKALNNSNKLICFDNLSVAFKYVSSIKEETIVLWLAKGSDIYLK